MLNSREKGKRGEDRAVEFLKSKGYSIVERNFYSKFGEIDIIAEREGVYHFVEVKSGTSFEPIYNINHSKLNKIVKIDVECNPCRNKKCKKLICQWKLTPEIVFERFSEIMKTIF